jgi:hypothetical protein
LTAAPSPERPQYSGDAAVQLPQMPAPAAPDVLTWKFFMVAGAEFLPLLAAWRAGRLRRGDPAGQTGLTWAFMNVCTFAQAAGLLTGYREVTVWWAAVAGVSLPLLLVPPLLTWIGAEAKRRQPLALAVFAALTIVPLVAFGPGREFTLLSRTTAHTALAALVLLMMASQFRRSANPQAAAAEPGWAWIAGGHLAYFLATIVGRALMEAVVARSWAELDVAASALFVTYALAMVAIGWGILASARQPSRPDGLSSGAPVLAPARVRRAG